MNEQELPVAQSPKADLLTEENLECTSDRLNVPIIDEVLLVSKKLVQQGGYRITKQVSSEQVLVDEPLQVEQFDIERRLIGKLLIADDVPIQRQEGDVLIIPVVKEVLVTEKRLVLVEEIRITRMMEIQRHSQSVVLRKEDVTIERLEPN